VGGLGESDVVVAHPPPSLKAGMKVASLPD
jgi:hypothetical protein